MQTGDDAVVLPCNPGQVRVEWFHAKRLPEGGMAA
ncbi:hypothetical protein N803_04385 [Knoellia subterranea KCTC 19937]|uniref:Uncharacterized protein n=1 Tax=Knoellia subterranea KCTC 19937 TaxID=1385521 RepID=A0A0A0JIJ2_9MICO|nr:hypothetical protein N803_04385 [Knoellia subterranea KCTC 19937]